MTLTAMPFFSLTVAETPSLAAASSSSSLQGVAAWPAASPQIFPAPWMSVSVEVKNCCLVSLRSETVYLPGAS